MRISDWSSDVCSSDLDATVAISFSRTPCKPACTGGVAQEASINPSIKLQRAVTCRSGLAVFQVQPGSSVSLPVRRSPAHLTRTTPLASSCYGSTHTRRHNRCRDFRRDPHQSPNPQAQSRNPLNQLRQHTPPPQIATKLQPEESH